MLMDGQIISKYGEPGDPDQLTTITLPYPMRIAWDPGKVVNKMQCHKLLSGVFLHIFDDLLSHYGLPEIQSLGIDLFGGCVNVRLMRGSKSTWSRHSWGIAIDLDPTRNGLKTKWVDSGFYKPEYGFMIDTFYRWGFINYGKEKDYDAMHFEIVS